MGKKVTHNNYRIEIEPYLGQFGNLYPDRNKEERNRCEDMLEQIKRHVDHSKYARINWDTEETCEHCGYSWAPDDDGNGCCEKEINEHEAKKAGAA